MEAKKKRTKAGSATAAQLVPAEGTQAALAIREAVPTQAHINGIAAEVLTAEDEAQLLERLSTADMAKFYLSNETEGRRAYQQSLDLFQEGTPIVEIKEDLLLKKLSQRVRFVKPLRLLQRQLHNALVFVARPNISKQEVFSVSLDYLSWLIKHNVNDYTYLKQSITEMQQSLMQIPNGDRWFSTQILQDVLIEGGMLYYKIPTFLRKLYGAPDRYYHVSMRMNAVFKSKYAHAMYELLREHQWRGETGYMPVAEFRERMGIGEDEYPEFKRLTSRVIQPALAELEELGDICAAIKYGRENRFVTSINLVISQNTKNQLALDGTYLDPGRYKELRDEFGLNQKQVTELTNSFKVGRIEEIADVLFFRYILNKQKAPVKNWFALFKSALKDTEDKYILTNTEKAELAHLRERRQLAALAADAQRRQQDAERIKFEAQKSQAQKLDEHWVSQSDEQKQTLWDNFLGSPEGKTFRQARKLRPGSAPDVTHPLARTSFSDFLKRVGQI